MKRYYGFLAFLLMPAAGQPASTLDAQNGTTAMATSGNSTFYPLILTVPPAGYEPEEFQELMIPGLDYLLPTSDIEKNYPLINPLASPAIIPFTGKQ